MMAVLSIVFGVSFTVAVCAALGRTLRARLGVALQAGERWPVDLVVGAALLSLMVCALGFLGLLYWWVFLAVGLAALAAAVRARPPAPAGSAERVDGTRRDLLPVERWLYGGVAAAFTLLYLCHAMAPEMSPDGSSYHLGLVARYLRQHGLERITTHMYSNLSQGFEMLFLFAFAFGRHSAAALVHFAFLVTLPLAILTYARRYGLGMAGAGGALFVYASPVVGLDGSIAYNDVATAAILFVLFLLVRMWWDEGEDRLAPLIGLLAGFAYAVKYSAGLAVPFALLTMAAGMLRRRRWRWKPLALAAACAGWMMAPWLIRNAVWFDNPFSPFFNQWFPNPYIHIAFEQDYRANMRTFSGVTDPAEIALQATVRGNKLGGLAGPVFLLAPVGLLASRRREGRWLWLGALVFGLPYAANIGTRFLIPCLPYVALAVAMVFARAPVLLSMLVAVHALASWPAVIPVYAHPHAWRLEGIRWKAALRLESEEGYLARKFPEYSVARMVEEKVPEREKILTFAQIPEAYTTRETLVVYQAAWNEVLGDMLLTPFNPGAQPARRLEFRFEPRRLRRLRVVQTASGSREHWSIAELRVYGRGAELPRERRWRLRAHPNPWDVQRAFDNSPATRWRSWEGLFDGMWVEVDFGAGTEVDVVRLECAADQPGIRLRLEGDAGAGWEEIPAVLAERNAGVPAGLRRMVAEEMKRAGVRYVLAHTGGFGWEDFRERAAAWNVSPLGEARGVRLYRFE